MRGRYGGVEYDSGQSISRQQLTDNFLAPFHYPYRSASWFHFSAHPRQPTPISRLCSTVRSYSHQGRSSKGGRECQGQARIRRCQQERQAPPRAGGDRHQVWRRCASRPRGGPVRQPLPAPQEAGVCRRQGRRHDPWPEARLHPAGGVLAHVRRPRLHQQSHARDAAAADVQPAPHGGTASPAGALRDCTRFRRLADMANGAGGVATRSWRRCALADDDCWHGLT